MAMPKRVKSVAWRRFQRDARKGKVTKSHMLAALSEAVREQGRVLEQLGTALGSERLKALAGISEHTASIIDMLGVSHVGEPAQELGDDLKSLVEHLPEARS